MHFLYLDAESYYDSKSYTLRKMTPAEYILDPRWEEIGWATRADGGLRTWIDAADFPDWLRQYPAEETITVTFNSLFDNCILGWRHNYVPKLMIDGLGMARALLGHKLRSLSLAKVSEHLGVGLKGDTIVKVDGMRASQIRAAGLWPSYTSYALNDIVLLENIFDILAPQMPKSEFRVMDLVLRAAVCPRFMIDKPLLETHLTDLRANKQKLIDACGGDKSQLMSASQFSALLEERGVEVELKTSPSGKEIPALAKTDEFMANLLEHEDPEIQALAAARLGVKSTIEETRGDRLMAVANLDWQNYCGGNGGTMPIPLRYGGAHTHRLSGDWKMNMQNLPSSRQELSRLRKALIAPPGHKVIVTDFGQIEARLTAWLCRATALMETFVKGLTDPKNNDPYKKLAMEIFAIETMDLVTDLQRFIGKSGVLGLGFGAGATKFYMMVLRTARAMGWDIPKLKEVWTPELAEKSVRTYRRVNAPIPAMWNLLDDYLQFEWMGLRPERRVGPVTIGDHLVRGPNGLEMRYDACPGSQAMNLKYMYGGVPHVIYGSKFLENIIQFLARILLMNAALRLKDRGLPFALQAHDELAFIVPDNDVDKAKALIKEEMLRPASWALDLPLTASISHGQSYGEAK